MISSPLFGRLLELAVIAGALSPFTMVAASDGVECEILLERSGQSVHARAWITSPSAVSGRYQLTAERTGGGGRSQVRQSAIFSSMPGAPTEIGHIVLGGTGTVEVTLELAWDSARSTCRKVLVETD